jgi:hypothetical protein
MGLTFGCYAGGLGETEDGSITPGPPEDPERIGAALDALHGESPFLVRAYLHYSDAEPGVLWAPPRPERYATGTRKLDLAVCFREPGTDLSGWLDFLRALLREHGPRLAKIQVAEEANHAGPGGDGAFPAVRQAIVEGVLAAREEVRRLGLSVGVGCNSTPVLDAAQEFWTDLGRRGGREFAEALDYAGLDFFPDVFRRIPEERLADAVFGVLTGFRRESLGAAGIPESTPMHITETGWATGADRPYRRQAEVLDLIVRTVAAQAETLNIQAYEHFALRDAKSDEESPFFQLGLMTSDYTPKPAFHAYRDLIAEFS